MQNYYRQFPSYVGKNFPIGKKSVSPFERRSDDQPNQWQNDNNYYDYNDFDNSWDDDWDDNWNDDFDDEFYYDYFNNINNPQGQTRPMPVLEDSGPAPFVINIDDASSANNNFRQAIWTGEHLQVTLMSIDVDSDIGFEVHPDLDQFIRIKDGEGLIIMGDSMENPDFEEYVFEDYAIVIPAGKWHNLINVGDEPLKLYSIYAPPEHPHGTVHRTKQDAIEDEH